MQKYTFFQNSFLWIAVLIFLTSGGHTSATVFGRESSDFSLIDIDVSAVTDLSHPGQAWERIPNQSVYSFEGLDVPLISILGSKKSWALNDAKLLKWPHAFPQATGLSETIRLPDGTVIGGLKANKFEFVKPQGNEFFELIPGADELYWSDYVEGSDMVFAKKSPDGKLLEFDGHEFVPSQFPEKGKTEIGEFLPWYSASLDGYFTAWNDAIWFYREGDPDWQQIEEIKPQSWAPNWGLFQRGSQEVLSPDGSLLKVISKNKSQLTQYRISDGRPKEMLPTMIGEWHPVGSSGDIVGWFGNPILHFGQPMNQKKIMNDRPQFVRLSPNSDTPVKLSRLWPNKGLLKNDTLFFTYSFATKPGSERIYFSHDQGFSYYEKGVVVSLPAEWEDIIGKRPKFLASHHDLYVTTLKGLYHVGQDDALELVLRWNLNRSSHWLDEVFNLDCGGLSVGFFQADRSIYSLEPNGNLSHIDGSSYPFRPYGIMPDGKSILYSELAGNLKLLSAKCE